MTTITKERRAARQAIRLPQDKLDNTRVVVVGVGAIGRQAALQLGAIGVSEITLYDHDIVEQENLAPQGFWENQLDMPKVDAVADHLVQINSGIKVTRSQHKFTKLTGRELALGETDKTDVVFMCVDSMETRAKLFESLKKLSILCIDGRMAAETYRILAWHNIGDKPAFVDYYPTTLFTDAEAVEDATCTQQSTIHNASAAAAFMVQQMSLFLRGMRVQQDTQVDLFSGNLFHKK